MSKASFRREGAAHFVHVRNVNRELLEKALRLRAMSYLADVKAALLVRTVTTVGESVRLAKGNSQRLQAAVNELAREAGARRRVEAELRSVYEAVDRAPIMFELLDARRQRVFANRAYRAAFGDESVTELAGLEPGLRERLRVAIAAGEPVSEELELDTETGSFWGRILISPESAADGEEQIGVFIEDVTRERRAAERLEQAKRLELIGRLSGGIAHDFNNVLAVIQASAETLTRPTTPKGSPGSAGRSSRPSSTRPG